ncbi:MAG: alpha-hydroxy-acid oxidizing protein [Roseiflexaceae bacterium]|nr:alpha-hydroxy-acid oxidizing protein [Roseiflexaceae bacterium]
MDNVVCLDDLEPLARAKLSQMAYDYLAGGAEDEWTLRENRAAFQRIQLLPRVLVNVTKRNLATTVLGTPVSLPVLVAPMAFHGLYHAEGELATARGAASAGTLLVASTASNVTLEQIAAEVDAPKWFQLYVYRDRERTRDLVQRAAAAGYRALCVTVDTPLVGRRERDVRNRFHLPDGLTFANFADAVPEHSSGSALNAYVASLWEPSFSWGDLAWLRSLSPLPLVLKGVLHPEDAGLAVEHGVAGLIVSNHGGRQLDTVPAPITILPRIAEVVDGRAELLLDGGVRRGTDVLKALALGARAVLVGRPVLWGLAVGGAEGVRATLELLRAELALALALAGVTDVHAVPRSLIF